MDKNLISPEAYKALIEAIFPIIMKNGMKGTTMDKVASSLSMSKRTLYEIFESKAEMLEAVIKYFHRQHLEELTKIFKSSDTMIEALFRILKQHQLTMQNINVEFLRDMDTYYCNLRNVYEQESRGWNHDLQHMIAKGIEQGVFLPDINYPVLLRMLRLQMESLKRMEEFFPPDISLFEAYDTICSSFIRSIASPKGIEILHKIINN